jgi:hypothetical protein
MASEFGTNSEGSRNEYAVTWQIAPVLFNLSVAADLSSARR